MESSPEKIAKILEGMKKDSRAITKTINEIVVFTKGAVSLGEAWSMSPESRKIFIKVFNDSNKKKAG